MGRPGKWHLEADTKCPQHKEKCSVVGTGAGSGGCCTSEVMHSEKIGCQGCPPGTSRYSSRMFWGYREGCNAAQRGGKPIYGTQKAVGSTVRLTPYSCTQPAQSDVNW